jgi:GT2 family glycosyltransferase
MPLTGVVIVNWNGCDDTIECLESLLRQGTDNFVTVVVDNGSSDGSLARFDWWARLPEPQPPSGPPWAELPKKRLRQPRIVCVDRGEPWPDVPPGGIVVIAAGENLGFAGGCNVGLERLAMDTRVDSIWLLNNDTVVAPDALARLRAAMEDYPEAALIGACQMSYGQPDVVLGVAGHFNPYRAKGGHIGYGATRGDLPPQATIEEKMRYVMGAAMFLPLAIYRQLGPMSEAYFLYYEELDWAARLKSGQRQTVCLEALVYHKEGGSVGSSSTGRPSDTSLYYLHASLLRYTGRWQPLFLPFALWRIVREGLHFLRRGDWRAVEVLAMALMDPIIGRSRKGPVVRPG